MALSAFSERFAMYDSTPVENLFLLEYMPHAPGDYVRVYLYGLMQCHHPDADCTVAGTARVLNLKEEQVLAAFHYWEQKGLVVGLSSNPPQFAYLNVRDAMLRHAHEAEDGAYMHRDYINRLSSMFEKLESRHHQKAMEWVEDFKLSPEVILTIVQERLDQLGGTSRKLPTPYLIKVVDNTVMDFSQRGINNVEDARRELMRGKPSFKLAVKVLNYLNVKRAPTIAEVELAQKWAEDWKLDEKAVMAALKQTTASANPSFAYIDRILERHSAAKIAGSIEQNIENDKALNDAVKQLLTELGASVRAVSDDQRQAYQHWLDMGFEPEVLLRAAVRCNRSGRRSFDQLEAELRRWHELGVTTAAKAEEHNKARDELRAQIAQVFDVAGIDRKPTEADLDQLREWRRQAPLDLILYAAGVAHGLKLPQRSMAKNLSEWAQKGIADVAAAQAERKARAPQRTDAPAPVPQQQQGYQQRQYGKDYFDGFFNDLDDAEGPK